MKLSQKLIKEIMIDTHVDGERTQDAVYYGFVPGSAYINYTVSKTDIGEGPVWYAETQSSLALHHQRSAVNTNRKTAVAQAVCALIRTAPAELSRQIIWD